MAQRMILSHTISKTFLFLLLMVWIIQISAETFTIGYMTNMHGRVNTQKQGLVISGAMSYALDVVNSNATFLNGHKLRMIYNDTEGDTLIGTYITIQQWREGAIAFFGPEDSCAVEATVASSLNLPMISYKCSDSRVSDKNFYKTFARTNPSDKLVVRSLLVLLKYYRWNKFTIVSEENNPYFSVAQSLEKQVSNGTNFTLNRQYFPNLHVCCEDKKPCCTDIFSKVVEETYRITRVYVFFGRIFDLIELMTKLQMRKLLDTREYAIIYVDLEAYSESASYRYFWRMDMRQQLVDMALQAAGSLLVIVPTPPQDRGYPDFVENVRRYNFMEPFEFPNKLPYPKHITEFAAYLYDSVILYAEALAQTLAENGDPRNGTAVIQKIIDKGMYQSVTGAWLHMDANGDVEGNYTVLSLQAAPHNLTLKGLGGEKNLSHLMLPMARFQYDGDTGEPIFQLLDVDIVWEAPPDEPPCGFDGKGCFDPPNLIREIISGILFFLLLILCVLCWIMYKKWKYEQEIAGLLWRIPLQDIQRYGSYDIISSDSKASFRSGESKMTAFTQTASYKGTLVATKTLRFKSKNIDIPRETKKEMKMMRELHQDNINPFIGACVQPHYILLVTEYCAKGSLKDILENPDIKLDHMFIASLVFDLIKGMIFLHDSDLKVHGNLKSSNCVVTSRWVLQVTDFGLRELSDSSEADFSSHDIYEKLLWRAPELLRSVQFHPKGTQKADVYSFAIVLHEILLRRGPFGNCLLGPREIVSRVCDSGGLFRPSLVEAEIQDYVLSTLIECWAENPDHRPDFRHVKEKLKRMKDGMTSNIMDNMMDMMERYANNLEDLVDERTAQLAEEQSKTEALLHRMLPKSVAEQLMRGEAVIPESFDAVTIYFSDIVGFTEMSATSTPMEVVTFLNDLYTVFDSILGNYDVYKVETIGDAYMVVSGLPLRNGDNHAAEIASMALDLLGAVKHFRVRHRPNHTLFLRIGIHSGPVVAGVVGLTMPRYCLFGDTVNTASRLESNGQPLKIHISEQCKRILENLGGYEIQSRGRVQMKGKGELETYWLLGHSPDRKRTRGQPLQPPLLFNIRDSESRRRSPKTEFLRRVTTPAQAHRSLEDSAALYLPHNLLRQVHDSPLARKRHSTVATKELTQWESNSNTKRTTPHSESMAWTIQCSTGSNSNCDGQKKLTNVNNSSIPITENRLDEKCDSLSNAIGTAVQSLNVQSPTTTTKCSTNCEAHRTSNNSANCDAAENKLLVENCEGVNVMGSRLVIECDSKKKLSENCDVYSWTNSVNQNATSETLSEMPVIENRNSFAAIQNNNGDANGYNNSVKYSDLWSLDNESDLIFATSLQQHYHDDVTKPLISVQRRMEHLKRFKRKYQPWRRSWSADVISQSCGNLSCNSTNSAVGGIDLHTVKENDTEESVV